MNRRICPNCKSVLGSHDQFYCTDCGIELPQELVYCKNPARLIPYSFGASDTLSATLHSVAQKAKEKKSFVFFKKHAVLAVPFFFIVIVIITIALLDRTGLYSGDFFADYYKAYQAYYNDLPLPNFMKKSPVQLSPQVETINADEILNLQLFLESKLFESERYLKYVPYDAELFVQVSDLDGFNNEYVLDGITKEASMSSVSKALKDNFVFFSIKDDTTNRDFAYIFEPEDWDKAQSAVSDFKDATWRAKFIDEILVFATNEKVFDEIEASHNNISKNISQNPMFVKANSNMPRSGQILFVSLDDEATLEILTDLVKTKKLHKELITYVEDIIKSNDLHFVVTNLR